MNSKTSRKWISAGAGALFLVLNSAALEITPEFVIVKGKTAGLPAENSPVILADHLEKMFGKRPEIIDSAAYNGKTPAIVLNEDRTLDPEEWSIRTEGKNLRIAGGYPRGLHYGCAEFLEKFGGVRWFTHKNHRIPKVKSITVPDGREFRRKPAFPLLRCVYAAIQGRPHFYSLAMNKNHCDLWLPSSRHRQSLYNSIGIDNCHTYYKLTRAVPKDRQDLLAIDSNGNRVRARNGVGPGQICFANKEFREFAKKEIGKWIEKQKAFIRKHHLDEKYAFGWIDLSPNDNPYHCVCSGCEELVRKYGTIAGAQLDFINDIASAYPQYIFQTLAYYRTVEPPKNILARENVLIQFAFLSDGRTTYYDTIRPLSHPVNAQLFKWYREWDKIAKNKAVWGYHRLYQMTEAFPWPQACFWYIGEDIRFYRDLGVRKIFVESELRSGGDRAFHDLHIYLAAKLMDDPDADEKKLTDEFFDFQYGPAASEMRAYANYLKKRLEAIPGKICGTPLQGRNCFDPEFFRTVNALLDRAEIKVKNDPERLENVRIERIPVDYAALYLWQQITSKTGLNRKALCDRLEKNLQLNCNRYYGKANEQAPQKVQKALQALQDSLRLLRDPIPIPPGMEKQDIRQISAIYEHPKHLVNDPDAALGKAVKLGEFPAKSRFTHVTQPMEFGVYNYNTRTEMLKHIIRPEEIPADEKYHLYRLGVIVPNGYEKQFLWGHRSWAMRITKLYDQLWNPLDPNREYELYISCKLTGPAYVKGSKSENAAYVDKLVAVKRGIRPPGENRKKTAEVHPQLPVPDEFKGKEIIQVSALKANPNFVVADSDSVCGKAVKLGEFPAGSRFTHATQPMMFGLYNVNARKSEVRQTIAPDQVPADEKYHFYKLGRVIRRKDAKQNLWGHRSWRLQINLLFNALPPGEYELYVSFKLTGPAYVKGSKKENAVYADRIIAVCLSSPKAKKSE